MKRTFLSCCILLCTLCSVCAQEQPLISPDDSIRSLLGRIFPNTNPNLSAHMNLEFYTSGAAYFTDGNLDVYKRQAVTILQVSRNQFGNSFCQIHSLFFKAFTNTALAAVDSGTNPDFRILFHDIVDNKFLTICFLFLFFCYKECLMCTSVGRYSFISLPDRTKSAASFPICSQSILMEVRCV